MLDNVPSRMVYLHRVRSLPLLGGLLAALLGSMLLVYTLAVSVRRRTRQLGVLRALGLNARRVGRVLVWQGVALALGVATTPRSPSRCCCWFQPRSGSACSPRSCRPDARRQHVSELLRAE